MRFLIAISFFVIWGTPVSAQIKFTKLYSDNGNDFGESIVQLADSSYTIVGSSSSFVDGPSQAFILRIDSLGERIWSKSYGGTESDGAKKVLYREGEGYWVAGYTNSFGGNDFDFYLFKTNEDGDLEWEKSYGGNGWERVYDATFTRDTCIVMVGETSSNALNDQQTFIVKTDQFGDTLWTQTFGIHGEDYATSIEPVSDSTFAIAGVASVQDSLESKAFIMYMHEDGTVYWEKTYGDHGGYWFNDVHFYNGEFYAAGGTQSIVSNGLDSYLARIDFNGVIQYQSAPGFDGDHYFQGFTKYGFIDQLFLSRFSIDQWTFLGGNDMQLDRVLMPNYSWVETCPISLANPDYFGEIIPTSDGSVILVGTKTGMVSGGNDVFVLKVEGDANCPEPLFDIVYDGIVAVDELFETLNLQIGPNPFRDELTFRMDSPDQFSFEVFDLQGRIIEKGVLYDGKKVNTSVWQDAFYILNIELKNGRIYSVKLVK